MAVQIVYNQANLNLLLKDPRGPVMTNMALRGERVKTSAQAHLSSSYPPGGVFNGDLQRSLRVAIVSRGDQNVVEVGSDLRYALFVEKGTAPGYRGNPAYASQDFFQWAVAHQFNPYGFGAHVKKFGTRAHPFLRPAITAAR